MSVTSVRPSVRFVWFKVGDRLPVLPGNGPLGSLDVGYEDGMLNGCDSERCGACIET